MASEETSDTAIGSSNRQASSDLLDALKSYFHTGQFSDFTIMAGSKNFKVHKLVLCSHSKYFSSLEDGINEEDLGYDEVDTDAFDAMLRFMYGLEYDSNPSRDFNAHGHEIIFHFHVYKLASHYEIPRLKEQAKKKFRAETNCWYAPKFESQTSQAEEIFRILYEVATTMSDDKDFWSFLMKISHKNIKAWERDDEFYRLMNDRSYADFAKYLKREIKRHK